MARPSHSFRTRPAAGVLALLGWSSPSRSRRRRPVPIVAAAEALESRLLLTAGPALADGDPDDQRSEAVALGAVPPGPIVRAGLAIGDATDVDLFSFRVVAGQTVGFDIDLAAPAGLDSAIRLFNAAGVELAYNDDGRAPGEAAGRASYLEYTFVAGTYFLGVSNSANRSYNTGTGTGDTAGTTGGYALTIRSIPPFDNDDQFTEALDLGSAPASGIVSGAIDDPFDVDMFKFAVAAGQRVSFDIDQTGGTAFNSYVRLFDAAGRVLAFNDNGRAPDDPTATAASFLTFTFTAAGTYYVGVSGAGNAAYNPRTGTGDGLGATGTFDLVITTTDTDDQIREATNLGALTAVRRGNGTIAPATDVDMYRFTATAGQAVTFDIDRPANGTLDSVLRLFDAAGRQLAINDDGAGPGEGSTLESFLSYTFAASGTYYVGVSGFGNSGYNAVNGNGDFDGSTGGYFLVVTPAAPPVAGDPDDQLAEATNLGALTATRRGSGAVSPATDVDMYRFTATVGQRVTFDVDRSAGSTLDSFIRLFNAQGTQLAFNNDGIAPGETPSGESFLTYTFTAAGTYYLGVSGFGNSVYNAVNGNGDRNGSVGGYILVVTPAAPPAGDPDDTLAEATNIGALTTPRRGTGTIAPATDVDLYRFTATAGQRVQVDVNIPDGLEMYLRLFDQLGNELLSNETFVGPGVGLTDGVSIIITSPVSGTYYLGISGLGNSRYDAVSGGGDAAGSTGTYEVVLTPLASQAGGRVEAANADPPATRNAIDRPAEDKGDIPLYAAAASDGTERSQPSAVGLTKRLATPPATLDALFAGDLADLLVAL